MTDYGFDVSLVTDQVGGVIRTARNAKVTVTNYTTGLTAADLKQNGQPVPWVTSDGKGRANFSSSEGVVIITSPNGLARLIVSPDYEAENINASASAASAASSAASSATSAAASAALVGAPAGTAIDTYLGGSSSGFKARSPLLMLDYCVGDGVTNDTAGAQAAFNAGIAQGRALYSPPGKTYLVDPLTAAAGLTLEGRFTFKARTTSQATVITPTGKLDWARASVTIDGASKALYGMRGSDVGRSLFGALEVKNCQIWGAQFNATGNNNHCQFARFTASANGAKVTQTLTETAETANVLTSSTGYGTFTLSTPLTAAQVAADATYFVISGGLAYKVQSITTTTIEVFNLKASGGVGGTVAADIIVGGGINYPSYGDSGVHTFMALDVLSNPGIGFHHGALYCHTLNNAVIQGNGIGFACNNSTQQFTFTKPYFELNTVDYASWSYVDGVMLAPLLNPANVQNLVGRVTGNGGFDPRMVIIKTQMRGMATDVVPALNPGSRTLAPGMTYQFHRTSGSWVFVVNNAAGYAAYGAYSILLELTHTGPTTNSPLSITLGTANGDTIEGGSSFSANVSGRVLLAVTKVGTDWKVSIVRDSAPATAITAAPVYVGQHAVVGAVAYIATGTSATTDWKQIT